MTFNNNISIESIIFITIILVLIWYIFRLYKENREYKDSLDFMEYQNMAKYSFLIDKDLDNEYAEWLDKYTAEQMEKLNG